MATWNGPFQAAPAGTDTPTLGDDEIRTTRLAIEERIKNEHTTYSGDSTGGVVTSDWLHKAGSAVAFVQATAPTSRVNGIASLIDGLLWYDTVNLLMKIRSGGSWVDLLPIGQWSFNIGDWNMDSTTTVTLTLPFSYTSVQDIRAIIRTDAGTTWLTLDTAEGWVDNLTGTQLQLSRKVGGLYDNTNYDSTGYNRGYVTVTYTP